jgi:hypothetical protein
MQRRFNPYILLLVLTVPIVSVLACENESGPIIQWSKTFGARAEDQGHSVQQTTDGGYIICGTTLSSRAQGEDVWLIKTDADGNKLWDKKFGGSDNDIGNSVRQTTDNGYILCGHTYSYGAGRLDIWLIKTDSEGNKLWDKTFGGENYDEGEEVKQTADGGYIICGTTRSFGESIWVIKTDSDGNKLWDYRFEDGKVSRGYSVQENKGGGYIAAGMVYDNLNHEDMLLIRIDADGSKIWDKTFDDGSAQSVQQTTDGGYIVCGRSQGIGISQATSWLIKTDAEGNKLWDKTFASGSKRMGTWDGDSAKQTADGGYIVCGTRIKGSYFEIFLPTASYIWVIRTDAEGNELWDKKLPGKDSGWGNSVQQTTDGGYIVCGSKGSYVAGGNSVLLLKIAAKQ